MKTQKGLRSFFDDEGGKIRHQSFRGMLQYWTKQVQPLNLNKYTLIEGL